MKRVNPYRRLQQIAMEYASQVDWPEKKAMFLIPIAKVRNQTAFSFLDIYERTKAAEQLGYRVVIEARDDGLSFQYIKKPPKIPYEFG